MVATRVESEVKRCVSGIQNRPLGLQDEQGERWRITVINNRILYSEILLSDY